MQLRSKIRLNTIGRPDCLKRHMVSGRGQGSCRGGKSGRGSDGQKARSGDSKPKTEGGQYPSYLRINKIGFYRKRAKIQILKLSNIDNLSKKLDKSVILLTDLINYFRVSSKLKIKILFDRPAKFCKECEAHFASKKVLEHLKLNFVK